MNLHKQTIKLEHLRTTDVMEWIKAHPEEALSLSYTTFVDKLGIGYLMVSLHQGNATLEDVLHCDEADAFEYKGMRRHGNVAIGWFFEIDGNVYYCSC